MEVFTTRYLENSGYHLIEQPLLVKETKSISSKKTSTLYYLLEKTHTVLLFLSAIWLVTFKNLIFSWPCFSHPKATISNLHKVFSQTSKKVVMTLLTYFLQNCQWPATDSKPWLLHGAGIRRDSPEKRCSQTFCKAVKRTTPSCKRCTAAKFYRPWKGCWGPTSLVANKKGGGLRFCVE